MATDIVSQATSTPASSGIGYAPTTQSYVVYGSTGDPGSTAVNEYTALTVPAFLRGVRFLAETLAGLPKQVFLKSGPGVRERAHDHPLDFTLNDEPNAMGDPFPFWTSLFHAAIVNGNGYALIERDPQGNVTSFYNLPSDPIRPFRLDGRQYYRFEIDGRPPEVIDADQILHVQGYGSDGMQGFPVVQLMAQTLRTSKAAENYAESYFTKGGHVGGFISRDEEATPEQMADLRAMVNTRVQGASNSHRWLVLADKWKAEPLTLQNDQAQMLETRQFQVLDVARFLSLEPTVFYDYGRATWNNLEGMGQAPVRYSLLPWLLKLEQQIGRKCLTRGERKQGYYIALNVDALTRADGQQLYEGAIKRCGGPYKTVNEERALQDLPPYPGGDVIRTPVNEVPLGSQSVTQPAASAVEQVQAAKVPPSTLSAPAVTLDTFGPLIADAAARVGTKTQKATDTAQAKFKSDPVGWTAWTNVFADEQARFAAAALAPVLSTIVDVTGRQLPDAERIGTAYAGKLRGHFSRLAKGEPSQPPDLAQITTEHMGEHAAED